MKAKREIIKNMEAATLLLNQIKEGMEMMTQREIQSAKHIHEQLSDIKVQQALSTTQKIQTLVEIEKTVSELIVQSQMQDILSQRIDHVLQTHQQLTAEINTSDKEGKYTRVFPDILKLNSWQTNDVQKTWAIHIKLTIDSWQLISRSLHLLEKTLTAHAAYDTTLPKLITLKQHSSANATPHYDELFMSSYWQQLDLQYGILHRQLEKEMLPVSSDERLDTLRELEKLYTMQAERALLIRLLEENHLISTEEMASIPKDSDDFSELF